MRELKPSILVIEDDPPIRKFLRASLIDHGYAVIEATTGELGLRHASNDRPDLVILDLGLPDIDGIDVTRRLREWSDLPIIVVSARGKEQDKIVALDAGADDYLTKPFGVGELLARVRVALRHHNKTDTGETVFTGGDVSVDFARRTVTVRGEAVHLTPLEYSLLSVFIRHCGKVLTHRQLLKEVWGPGVAEESHYVRVYVNQLREKIERDPARPTHILTETGIGYRFAFHLEER
jgi:two-component system KDP operon response regulator KdpE